MTSSDWSPSCLCEYRRQSIDKCKFHFNAESLTNTCSCVKQCTHTQHYLTTSLSVPKFRQISLQFSSDQPDICRRCHTLCKQPQQQVLFITISSSQMKARWSSCKLPMTGLLTEYISPQYMTFCKCCVSLAVHNLAHCKLTSSGEEIMHLSELSCATSDFSQVQN